MADRPGSERWVTNVTVVTGIMAFVGVLYVAGMEIYRIATSASAVVPAPVDPAATPSVPTATATPSAAPTRQRLPGPLHAPAVTAKSATTARFSNRVRLRDGEQSVMLQGRLGVGISFTAIGSTTLATLRIVHGGEERSEALIPLQRQFIVEVGGRKYSVATVAVELGERTAVIQVDELGAG